MFTKGEFARVSKMQQHWSGYITALGGQRPPAATQDLGVPTGIVPTHTGFQPIKVFNPNAQKKYDAMSASWMGVQASENAAASNTFKTSFMPVQNNK